MFNRSRRQSAPPKSEAPPAAGGGWLMLVAALPTGDAAARMKVLRTFETLGAGVLREGAYLMPDSPQHRQSLERLAEYIRGVQGEAWLVGVTPLNDDEARSFRARFDRTDRYVELEKNIAAMKTGFGLADASAIARLVQRQREELEALASIDFFGSPARERVARLLAETENAVNDLLFPQAGSAGAPPVESRKQYFRKTWATRTPLSVDRLASGWLIRRFIDPEATMTWLDKHAAIPDAAVTFGFEGAQFANSRARVTFEELVHSFRLHRNAALVRIGTLVKALDTGDVTVAEARGVETMLAGARHRATNDDELLRESEKTFDLLFETYYEPPGKSKKQATEKA